LAQIAEAQRPFEQMVEQGRGIFIPAFTDHFENCVNAVNRARRLFDLMKGEPIS
jgi:hypothetical protein